MTVETIAIKLNPGFTHVRFPKYWNQSLPNGTEIRVGCDAVVCVQKYEPWIVEAYRPSRLSSFILRVVGGLDDSASLSPSGIIQGPRIGPRNPRNLDATGKDIVFSAVYNKSVDRFLEANLDRGQPPQCPYCSTDTVGPTAPPRATSLLTRFIAQISSFTEWAGPPDDPYLEFSPFWFARFRARVGAVNVLPYLVGSGPVVAQFYLDETLAYATYEPRQLIVLPVLVLILGTIGELFVPALPLGIPRREFGIYSWLALLQSRARGFSHVRCTRANRMLTSRSCNLRRRMTSISSRASKN